jgi:hypothetical protein
MFRNINFLFIGITLFFFYTMGSCQKKHDIEIYNEESSKQKLSSLNNGGNLTIYPLFNIDESKIIDLKNLKKELTFLSVNTDELKLYKITKVNGIPINLYNTVFVNGVPYSSIWIDNSKLNLHERYYLSHILRNILFENIDDIISESKKIEYCKDVNCNFLSPLIVSSDEKKQFALIHFINSKKIIKKHKDILIKYLLALQKYLSKSGFDSQTSGHLGNNIVLALNELDDNYRVDPL